MQKINNDVAFVLNVSYLRCIFIFKYCIKNAIRTVKIGIIYQERNHNF